MSDLVDTQYEFLVYRTEMGARRIFGEDWANDDRVVDRLKTELDLIRTKDFASYFLMLSIFIQRVREVGDPGRPRSWFIGRLAGRLCSWHYADQPT